MWTRCEGGRKGGREEREREREGGKEGGREEGTASVWTVPQEHWPVFGRCSLLLEGGIH